MRTGKVFLLAAVLVSQPYFVSFGQENLFRQSEAQVLSPGAYEICKYGKVPVNYFNGLPEISVPLAEVYAKGYTLPVYLTYHASGNKPDQHPGWVGQGWTLHAGGSISRVIHGDKDEMDRFECAHFNGAQPSYDPGYVYHAHRTQQNINWSDLDTLYQNTLLGATVYYDYEPDEFFLNLEGLQASFYITGDGTIEIVSRNDASFDVSWDLESDTDYNALTVYAHPSDSTKNYRAHRYTYFKRFTVRDREGNTYIFGGDDRAIEYSVSQRAYIYYNQGSYVTASSWDATATANAWMLTKIIRADGEEISFFYKNDDNVPIALHDFHYGESYAGTFIGSFNYSYDTYSTRTTVKNNLSFTFLLPAYLDSLSCRVSGDHLKFNSSVSTELGYVYNEEDFVRRVGNYNGTVFPMSFNDFKAKDHYLKLDSISGEGRNIAFSYTNSTGTRLKLNKVRILNGSGGSMDHQYKFKYNTTPLPAYNSRETDRWGFYNGQDYSSTVGSSGHNMYAVRAPNATYMQAEILTDIYYPTGGRSSFEYEPHSYFRVATQFPFSVDTCPADSLAGGLRVKRITDRDSTGVRESRTFSYLDTYSGVSHSSGILSGRQRFHTSGVATVYAYYTQPKTYSLTYEYFNELPFNRLSDTDGNHVTYSFVTETFADGGSVTYRYSNHDTPNAVDNDPVAQLVTTQTDLNLSSKFNSGQLFRGLLLERQTKKSGGSTVLKESFSYNLSHQASLKSVSKSVFESQIGIATYSKIFCGYPYLSGKTVTSYQDIGSAITDTYSYQYNTVRRPVSWTHTEAGVTDGAVTFYPADRSGTTYSAMLQAGMSGVPVGQVKLRKGNVVYGQELTYKALVVEAASGTRTTYVPDKCYSTELATPVVYSSYSANPSSYLSSTPDIEFLTYDNHANLTGSVSADGIGTAYLWSANALKPTLVAKGVNPGQVGTQDVSNSAVCSLVFGESNSYSKTFSTSGPSTITFTIQAAYGYDWLGHVSVDGQNGTILSIAIPETPPEPWMSYSSLYNQSIQFSLAAGTHYFTMSSGDNRKGPSGNSNPAGTITCTYKEATQTITGREEVAIYDFEEETGGPAGFHSAHSHYGTYTINLSIPSDRNYVVDYMLYENNVWQYHRESYTGGSKTLGNASKRIDNIRVFPADCDLATAGYDNTGLMNFRTDARGVTESYEYDGLRRLVRILDNSGSPVEQYIYNYAHGNGNTIHNSVTTKTYTAANNTNSFRTAISYLDSLGRPSQNVLVNGAASGWDLVTYQDYDACGRELRKWLPAPVQVASGHAAGAAATIAQIQSGGHVVYDPNSSTNDPYKYSQSIYEASPRDRVLEYYDPGSAWRSGSGHKVKTTLMSNVASTSAVNYYRGFSLVWTGNTALSLSRSSAPTAGTMQIIQTEDEDGQKTLQFKDSFGETVLVRKVLSSGSYLDTHYVYDSFGRLAVVLPPKFIASMGSTTSWNYNGLSDLAYLYRYDSRGNCIARSLPGAGWTYTVYDKGNRPVLTQDAAQRAQNANYWTFAILDHLGRPALRGTTTMSVSAFSDPYKTAVVQAALPKTPTYTNTYKGYVLSGISLSSPVLLEVDYYDNYAFAGASPFPAANNADFAYDSTIGTNFSEYYSASAQGQQTGSLLKVLDNTTGNQYLWAVSYYDDRARVVQHRASTHLGGVEKDWFLYDFVGNATKRKTEHKPSSGASLVETVTQTYDTWDRPLVTQHQIGSGTVRTVSNRTYDKAGRLATESRSGNAALKSTYAYNIRSWLTGISGTLFTETLNYQDGTTPRWGGDISQAVWKDNRATQTKTYSFGYDLIGRLKTASFTDAAGSTINFAENVTEYDGNGNILGLQRYGRTGASTYGLIDNLVYTYSGNKLSTVKDTGSAAYSSDFRFSNGTNNTYAFSYDAAGRMTADASKGISSITWNVLGLPQTVTFSSGAVINYRYAADGSKLRETRTVSSTTTTTDYTGNLILENGTRSRLLFEGGYVSVSNSGYHFFISDHLGSVRVVANTSGTAEEYDHYYPLGGPIAQYSSSTSLQPLKFQGKEWGADKGLNLYDFGARRYDPATGRWVSQDPLSEKYYAHSPYLFCAANPMKFVDPTGTSTNPIFDEKGNFLGVDDAGFNGTPLFMFARDYSEGLSHSEAMKRNNLWLIENYSSSAAAMFRINYQALKSRPDWDGFVTVAEGIKWAKNHEGAKDNPTPNNTLYVDASKLNLGYYKDGSDQNGMRRTNLYNVSNVISSLVNSKIRSTAYALGRFNYEYYGPNSSLRIINNEATVYDWNYGGGFLRNVGIFIERARTGINDSHGFKVFYYGQNSTPQHK